METDGRDRKSAYRRVPNREDVSDRSDAHCIECTTRRPVFWLGTTGDRLPTGVHRQWLN